MKHTSTEHNCAAEILLLSLSKQKLVIKLARELHSVCKIQSNLVLVLQLRAKYCLVQKQSAWQGNTYSQKWASAATGAEQTFYGLMFPHQQAQ